MLIAFVCITAVSAGTLPAATTTTPAPVTTSTTPSVTTSTPTSVIDGKSGLTKQYFRSTDVNPLLNLAPRSSISTYRYTSFGVSDHLFLSFYCQSMCVCQ